jgi:integrase
MATFRVTIKRNEERLNGTTNIKIRVCHNKKTRYVATDYYVLPEYFDNKTGTVRGGGPYSKDEVNKINSKLQIKLGVMADKAEKQKNLRFMDIGGLMKILRDKHREYDFFALVDEKINTYKKLGNFNYMDSFKTTKTVVENFCGTSILPFETIDYNFLTRLENSLKFRGVKANSIGVFMRNIRTIYNQAISMGLVELSLYPFRKYHIPKETTRHRDLTAREIAAIAKIEIKEPLISWARDMFMLSFYLIGINMKDLMYVEKIEEGRINYKRSKGKRDYSVKVWPEAMDIINKYPGEKYLLNALDNYSDYRSATKRINKKMKDVGALCKIQKPVSTYYARHAWGTIASSIGISLDNISRALGHRLVSDVTIIYVKEDQEAIDRVNRKVIDHIHQKGLPF